MAQGTRPDSYLARRRVQACCSGGSRRSGGCSRHDSGGRSSSLPSKEDYYYYYFYAMTCSGSMSKLEQSVVLSKMAHGNCLAYKHHTCEIEMTHYVLIVLGKISAEDVASEMGISLGSLQAALVGETTSFSPGLKLKIIKWLQNSIHVSALQPSKLRNSLPASSEYKVTKVDSLNSVKEKDYENRLVGAKVTSIELSDAVLVKSLSPWRTTKSQMTVKNNDKTPILPSVLENSNGNIDGVPLVINEDISGKKSSNLIEAMPNDQNLSEMITEDTLRNDDSNAFYPVYGPEGNPLRVDSNNLSYGECNSDDVEVKVTGLHNNDKQAEDANAICENKQQQEYSSSKEFNNEVDAALSYKFHFENGALGSISDIHPLINVKMLHLQNLFKKTPGDPTYDVNSCPQCIKQGLPCSCTDTKCSLGGAKFDQTSKVKNVGLLELSPQDEVEEEIVYAQSKLLDIAMTIKHKYDDLLWRIVKNLPRELNESSKRKWDLILVNQFFREVKEAKKRGRKEKKYKEAQAVLAAAAEAAAISSRNSSLRKDTNDEIMAATQEASAKLKLATGGAGLPSVRRPKEALRSSVPKLTSDKQSMIFQMPEFLKDNVLSCEICMRTETILKRIFVCSRCKVPVHLDCYRRISEIPVGPWKCERCEEMPLLSTSPKNGANANDRYATGQCGVCGILSGAMRKSADGRWVHAFCAEESISKGKDNCSICHLNIVQPFVDYVSSFLMQCSYGNCKSHFHPFCASNAGFYMNAKVTGSTTQHKAYCGKHSVEQREADNRQCGVEDLKNLKQIRVSPFLVFKLELKRFLLDVEVMTLVGTGLVRHHRRGVGKNCEGSRTNMEDLYGPDDFDEESMTLQNTSCWWRVVRKGVTRKVDIVHLVVVHISHANGWDPVALLKQP
ncbi:hypothetical protein ZIOFF_036757 [Zingiber officinale]|uniref:PHD-type domain-containing protein n=1 Tax=Zingiber officinale TaxID=94328 RepID=A0A8J5GIL8_ZINOF|nr:hypothetical protein ZIOFF_036757 [Zingiber officinale]